ncbi:MAG: endonuclease/exonuclease/phosphatase family protein [Verrucomicrobia bacterium]|nr:endonuclease/exonuclease/phosphatase family protein [Verrucomicrobiota bacterium]
MGMRCWKAMARGSVLAFVFGIVLSTRAEEKPFDVRVMSFNIRYYDVYDDGVDDWKNRREMVAKVITDAEVDLLGLQEDKPGQLRYLGMKLRGFRHFGKTRDESGIGPSNAIFYRKKKFKLDDRGTFWFSDTPDTVDSKGWGNKYSRICTWARLIDRETGQGVYLFNAHMDHASQYSRERSAVLMGERIAAREHNDPFIITGDMNAKESNSVIRYFKGDEMQIDGKTHSFPFKIQDSFRVKNGKKAYAGTFNGFGTAKKGYFAKLDYILTEESSEVLDATVIRYNEDGRYPSDHCPITAHINIGNKH